MRVSIGFYHPDVDSSYAVGTAVSNRHPSIQSALSAYLPSGHPNCDTLLANPSAHPLPFWHPTMSALITRRARLSFTVDTSSYHPNATTSFASGIAMPASHASVQSMMASVLGTWHPNVDTILRNPAANPMPVFHPPIDQFISRLPAAPLPRVSIGFYHPDVDASYAAGTAVSSRHPSLQALLASDLPSSHPNVDTLLANPSAHTLPSWHPALSGMVARRTPLNFTVDTSSYHPNATTSFASGTAMPASHASVQSMMASVLGTWHPNVDTILRNPAANPMPALHPPIDQFISRLPEVPLPQVSIGFYHPDVDVSYAAGTAVSSRHPSLQALLTADLPFDHPNIDTLLANPGAHPLPDFHPVLSNMVTRRTPLTFTVGTSSYHPNATVSFASGRGMPSAHVSVQDMMASVLGTWHPNVDTILMNPAANPMPVFHPHIDQFILRGAGAPLPQVSIGFYHPDVAVSYAAGTAVSSRHPSIQAMMADSLPVGHPNVDTLLANPAAHPLPELHPALADMILSRAPVTFSVPVLSFHINVTDAMLNGSVMPSWHPSVQSMMSSVLGAWHPNVDSTLQV